MQQRASITPCLHGHGKHAVSYVRVVHRRTRQSTRARPAPPLSASSAPASTPPVTGRAQVLELLAQGQSHYSHGPELGEAIERMIPENPTANPGIVVDEGLGTGTWQASYGDEQKQALAKRARHEPRYKFFPDGRLISNVQYNSPLVGKGWLSSSGTMKRMTDDTVEIAFDKFWVDLGPLREELPDDAVGSPWTPDGLMTAVGRAAFFPQFAVFPVLYMDQELAVFEFPPLKSKIAIRRIA